MISITRNAAYVDFNEKNLDNVRFIKLNSYPAKSEHATSKNSVDQSKNEATLVGNKKKEFNTCFVCNTSLIALNSESIDVNHVATKSYVNFYLKTIEIEDISQQCLTIMRKSLINLL